jgi:crossover junction endodeoxyribonuclease RusA
VITVPLPYRTPPLTMNGRMHWAVKGRVTKQVRQDAWTLARALKIPPMGAVITELVWFKGDNRRADAVNIAATLKPLEDGLVDAGVLPDDSADRVLSSRTAVVLKRDDPQPDHGPRMELRIIDASVLAQA